jgi:hypothetical protein
MHSNDAKVNLKSILLKPPIFQNKLPFAEKTTTRQYSDKAALIFQLKILCHMQLRIWLVTKEC